MKNKLNDLIEAFQLSLPYSPGGSAPQSALTKARAVADPMTLSEALTDDQIDTLARQVNEFATVPGPTYIQRQWLVAFASAIRTLIPPKQAETT